MSTPFPPPDYIPAESAVDGITVYKPKPIEEEERPDTVEFTCPRCNATTAYSIAAGGLECTKCGYYEPPEHEVVGKGAEQFEFKVEVVQRAAHGWGEARKEMQCQNCYGITALAPGSLTTTCPFCGSSKVIQAESKQDALRPRFLIPITLEEAKVHPIVDTWLGSSWMLPGKLQSAKRGTFNAIYLPFWTFDARGNAQWRAEVGYEKTVRYRDSSGDWQTRTEVDWRWETGRVSYFFDDFLISGTRHVTQGVLERIRDFDMSKLVPYEPKYLAGINAQAYEIKLDEAWGAGRTAMRERMRTRCEQDALEGDADRVRNMQMTLDFDEESWRYILLPVYLAPYTYNDETYQIVVNAQTGAIAGTRPVDWTKVAVVSGLLFLPTLILGIIGLLLPPLLCGAGLLFLLAIGGVLFIVNQAMQIVDPNRKPFSIRPRSARGQMVDQVLKGIDIS